MYLDPLRHKGVGATEHEEQHDATRPGSFIPFDCHSRTQPVFTSLESMSIINLCHGKIMLTFFAYNNILVPTFPKLIQEQKLQQKPNIVTYFFTIVSYQFPFCKPTH